MSHEPIAYTYEADYHCPDCAEERFGRGDLDEITGIDNEGNEIGAIFPWSEWIQGIEDECEILVCSDCNGEIDESHLYDCEEYAGDRTCTLASKSIDELLDEMEDALTGDLDA